MRPGLLLRGLAMGAAEVVPGVSGGTIAFVTGIYDELLRTLARLDWRLLAVWRERGFAALWQEANATFLLWLGAGMFVGVIVFARLMKFGLEHYPPVVWALFFGLILYSIVDIGRQVPLARLLGLGALGAVCGFVISSLTPSVVAPSLLWIFAGGALAVSAWLLPAVSGSFLLLVLGLYEPVLGAITDVNVPVIAALLAGCGVGLLLFARLLHWLMGRYRQNLLAVLVGFHGGFFGETLAVVAGRPGVASCRLCAAERGTQFFCGKPVVDGAGHVDCVGVSTYQGVMNRRLLFACIALLLAGCMSRGQPLVAERSPIFDSGADPGHYAVQRGDTLYSIAWRYDLDVAQLAQRNGLQAPFTIYPGQRLRVTAAPAAPVTRRPGRPPARALPGSAADWRWPVAAGPIRRFADTRRGLDYRLPPGTAVRAAAGGKVVYAGVGIGGYEDLIIIDHGADHLSAYGFSGERRVEEGERIKVAQTLADIRGAGPLGHSLHFEVRRRGRPIDPGPLM